jgi:hypothetical protein
LVNFSRGSVVQSRDEPEAVARGVTGRGSVAIDEVVLDRGVGEVAEASGGPPPGGGG